MYSYNYNYRGKKITLVKLVGFVWLFVLLPLLAEGM